MKNRWAIRSSRFVNPNAELHLGRHNRLPILSTFHLHFFAMYSDAMFTFAAAADKLGLTVDEVLELLNFTVDDAEQENLSVDEVIEACFDCGLEYDDPHSYYAHA